MVAGCCEELEGVTGCWVEWGGLEVVGRGIEGGVCAPVLFTSCRQPQVQVRGSVWVEASLEEVVAEEEDVAAEDVGCAVGS